MLWQRDQKKSCNLSLHDYFHYFFLSLLVFLHQRKSSICVGLNCILWPVSFSCCLHLLVLKEHLESTLRNALCCFSPAAHSHLYPLFLSITITVFVSAEKNNSDGRGGSPADLLIIHHSHVVFIVRSGWVSSSNLHIPSIRVRLHYDSEDDWEGICSLQESGQLHCFWHAVRHSASPELPAPSDPAWCGWNSNEHSIWALSLEYALKCH